MKIAIISSVAAASILMALSTTAQAGDLVYEPINPSFGGDPFVGSYLLGKAQAQDTNKDPSIGQRPQPLSSTERLLQRLESRLISDLINDVSTNEDVSEGSFESEEFGVVVSDNNGQLDVRVIDKMTGDETKISVGGLFNP